MRRLGSGKALGALLGASMATVCAIFVVRPPNDPDFFWHLKTGEWIWRQRGLLVADPFNFLNQGVAAAQQRFVLTSSWLSEVLYHLLYARWGFPGIVALKLLIAALLVLALLRLRVGDPLIHAAVTLAALPLFFLCFFDRPQVFSMLFFAVLLALLERERTLDGAPAGWMAHLPIPALMLAWANMHGGYAVGQLTIVLYLALEGVKFVHPALRPAGWHRYLRLAARGSAGVVASFANPNSWRALQLAALPAPNWIGNAEYLSTVSFYRIMHQPLILVFWCALALAALQCLLRARRPDITQIALLVGMGWQGFLHIRYLPFFMIVAVPVIGELFSADRARTWARPALVAGAIALVVFFSRDELPSRASVSAALGVSEAHYPVRAADFVLANNLAGNLYNTYLWGGYLLWRLAPARQVFVDGRGLNTAATFESGAIAMAMPLPPASQSYWKNLLRRRGVGYLVLPRTHGNGFFLFDNASGLRAALLEAPEWVPVFADTTALVYALNTPEHREVIAAHALPKRTLGAAEQ